MISRRHFPDMPVTPPPRRQLHGLDYQGRHPEAAHAATDMGVEPHDLACAEGIVRAVLWTLAAYTVAIVVWVWLI